MQLDEKIILTDNGKRVLEFMQLHSERQTFVGKDLGEEMQMKGIYSVLNSLVNKGLVDKQEPIVRDFTNNKGVTKPKEYKTYALTNSGKQFVID